MKTRRPALPPLPSPLPGARRRTGTARAIQAYASTPSAPAGGTMEFRVSVPSRAACSVTVRRVGTPVPTPAVRFAGEDQDGTSVAWVRVAAGTGAGAGAGRVSTGAEALNGGGDEAGSEGRRESASGSGLGGGDAGDAFGGAGSDIGEVGLIGADGRPDPLTDGVGVPLMWCDWEPSLLLDIPESWPPGLYVARFSVEAPLLSVVALRGRSAYVPFVVRAPLAAGFPALVILPFAAYAATNPWPTAEVRRARAVSLDRPFAGNGLPEAFAGDAAFVEALADADFATSLDLHAGAVDPGAYRKVLYRADVWSAEMRAAMTRAALGGTDVGGMEGVPPASVAFAPGPDGRPGRVLIRY
ncbi:MAG: hypothetical protein HOV83_21010 [Catenulispora sp.]|nr:hypothetical protein [Catenulispora sp.]